MTKNADLQCHYQNTVERNRRIWGWKEVGCSQCKLRVCQFLQSTQASSSSASLSPEITSESSATCW